jgi:hypothetical protein
MQRLQTIKPFVRVLVALFLVAQLAGVVASPLSGAAQAANGLHVHHHHADGQSPVHHHGEGSGDHADYCCALHAFFAGVMPPAFAVAQVNVAGERLAAAAPALGAGISSNRLDRPPRPFQ